MGIPEEEFTGTISWMEEELIDEMGDEKARIPLNEMHKEIFYTLNPREPKFFPLSISAMAKIFYAANENWTHLLSSMTLPIMVFSTGTKLRQAR